MTVPIGERTALTGRIMHALQPEASAGLYEIRWQRKVDWPGFFRPDYAGVGGVGGYLLETGRYGRVTDGLRTVTRPHLLSPFGGLGASLGRRLSSPIEISVLAHP